MKKNKLWISLVSVSLSLSMLCTEVDTVYASPGFLSQPYEVTEWTFDNNDINKDLHAASVNTVSDVYGRSGNSLVINGGSQNAVCYIPSEKGFYGRTEISFKLAARQLSGTASCVVSGKNCDFSGEEDDIFILEFQPKSYDNSILEIYASYGNAARTKIGETVHQLWHDINLQIDTVKKTINVQIDSNSDILVYWQGRSLLTNHSLNDYCISKLLFNCSNTSDAVCVDNFAVKRSGNFNSQIPVVARHKNVYTAGAKIINNSSESKDYVMFLSEYTSQAMLNLSLRKTTVPPDSIGFIETFLQDDIKNANKIKAYVWEASKLKPNDAASVKNLTNMGELYNEILLSSGFEGNKVYLGSLMPGKFAPSGWGFFNWAKPSQPNVDASVEMTEVYEGQQSVYISAVTSSMAGWTSGSLQLPRQGIKTVYMIKQSADYAGNAPYVFITFFDSNNNYLGMTPQAQVSCTSDMWTKNTFAVNPSSYPAGAKYYVVNLTTSKNGTQAPAGKLYFDFAETGGMDVSEISQNINMVASELGSWYVLGSDVVFTAAKALSPFVTDIKGEIFDSYGNSVADVAVNRNDFDLNGWRWQPEKPGFYDIRFYANINNVYYVPIYSTVKRTDLDTKGIDFDNYVKSVVVAPSITKSMAQRNPKMAFSYQLDGSDYLQLADKVGFSTARIHAIPWGAQFTDETMAIHTGPGQFNWAPFDEHMTMLKNYNFNILGNILYTPKWASPSSSDKVNICVKEFSAYAPVDMEYLEEFLDALIDRYGNDIDTWEVWNEPHLPGGSVFWLDTPENYVELLKTAYTKIKQRQPNSQVWIGGIGAKRYLSFYSEILRLGAYPYFDKLSMHGYDVDPWNYNRIAASMGLPEKDYANTEGHFTLITTPSSEDVYISERRMAFRLMLELLRQFKYNASLITKFSIFDWNSFDVVSWAQENNVRVVSDGLFNKGATVEPRLNAIVMHMFMENIGYNTEFDSEIKFSSTQEGAVLKCDNNDIVVLWSKAEEGEQPCEGIRNLITEGTVISDWEGKTYNLSEFVMQPYTVYYIKNPNKANLDLLPDAKNEVVFSEYEKQKETANVPSALGNNYAIFNHNTKAVEGAPVWVTGNWAWKGSTKPNNYNAKFAIGKCSAGLDFIFDITDDYFNHNSTSTSSNQDMILIGIDTLGNGITSDNMVIKLGWDESRNKIVCSKIQTPNLEGNLPANWTEKGVEIANKNVSAVRNGNVIRFYVHIDNSELYPYFYTAFTPLRLSVSSVNYDNGNFIGYYEWGGGLTSGAYKPSLYGKINFPYDMFIEQQNDIVTVDGYVSKNTPLCLQVTKQDNTISYVNQSESGDSGYYKFSFPLTDSGRYIVTLGGLNFDNDIIRQFDFNQ